MACFFHSFVRAVGDEATANRPYRTSRGEREYDEEQSAATLRSILEYGLLCTPEWLSIRPDRRTDNPRKQQLLRDGKPEYRHSQSRFCLTLCEPEELYRRMAPSFDEVKAPLRSHADLFGYWAIGFDALLSRRLGFLPTNYFAPTDMFGARDGAGRVPGLNLQMIQRLKETRELLILLAYLEQGLEIGDYVLPSLDKLEALQLDLPYEPKAMARVRALSPCERRRIFELFDIDRPAALDLVDYLEMMFGLFQETDSTRDATPYAFYRQREWRLIHHERTGMQWYCLGSQPSFRNPLARDRLEQVNALRAHLSRHRRPDPEGYFRGCWVLEEVDGLRPADYVNAIIVPRRSVQRASLIAREFGCPAAVVAAEDCGYEPPDPRS